MKANRKRDLDFGVFALELARSWKNGGVDASIFESYFLGNLDADNMEQATKFAYDMVCLLAECDFFKASPDINQMGFSAPDVKHPEFVLCREMNARTGLSELRHELVFEDGLFKEATIFPHDAIVYVCAGISQIAQSNGSAMYSLCKLDSCGDIFRVKRAGAMFCSTSHKVRASQLRLKNSES